MKTMVLGVLAALALGGAAWADPVLGTWKTEVDDGSYAHIEMDMCGEAVCGVIARTFDAEGEYRSENIGKTLVIDMEPQGGGEYKGKVWRPSNDKIYIGRMELDGHALYLDGCVLGGLICKTQTWSRVN